MTPEQFTYWLKGFFEISNSEELTPTQVLIVKDHLNLVFNKVTPDRNNTYCWKTVSYGDSNLREYPSGLINDTLASNYNLSDPINLPITC